MAETETSYLLEGAIIMIIIIIVSILILTFSPEAKAQAEEIIGSVFGFVSDNQEIEFNEDALDSWTKSLNEGLGDGCFCDFKRGMLLEGNQIYAINEPDGISLTLFDSEKKFIKSAKIVGKKLALMQRVYDEKEKKAYLACIEEDLMLINNDGQWVVKERRVEGFRSIGEPGDHIMYPRAKSLYAKGDTLCLVTEKVDVGDGDVDLIIDSELIKSVSITELEVTDTREQKSIFPKKSVIYTTGLGKTIFVGSAKTFLDSVKVCNSLNL